MPGVDLAVDQERIRREITKLRNNPKQTLGTIAKKLGYKYGTLRQKYYKYRAFTAQDEIEFYQKLKELKQQQKDFKPWQV